MELNISYDCAVCDRPLKVEQRITGIWSEGSLLHVKIIPCESNTCKKLKESEKK